VKREEGREEDKIRRRINPGQGCPGNVHRPSLVWIIHSKFIIQNL